jgi:two-component system phosphate regulon sensor histidine kinase PhoR
MRHFLLGRIWALAAGLGVAALALAALGPQAVWGLLALVLAAAIISRFIVFQAPPSRVPVEPPEDPAAAILSPLVRQLLAHLPAPVMLLDGDGRIFFVNDPMRAVVGPGSERKQVSAVLRVPAVLDAVRATAASGDPSSIEFILPVPIERHYQGDVAQVSSNPPATALLLHDLTGIRRSEQMRADFVANASHELRTPLAAVSGFIDTLRGHAKDDPDARDQFLGIMAVESARMRRLIDDLLSLTRIELNEHVPPSGRVFLRAIVEEAVAALGPLAAQDRITVSIMGGEGLPPVTGDRDELIQLFQNLIHNAIKYGREGGEVSITLQGQGAQVSAAVKDDGEGIPANAIPRLTERFYRVDVQRSRQKGGTGLGLAIVKHIVSRHHGRLTIESRPGEGSVFTVTLPVQDQELPAKPLASPAIPSGVTEML